MPWLGALIGSWLVLLTATLPTIPVQALPRDALTAAVKGDDPVLFDLAQGFRGFRTAPVFRPPPAYRPTPPAYRAPPPAYYRAPVAPRAPVVQPSPSLQPVFRGPGIPVRPAWQAPPRQQPWLSQQRAWQLQRPWQQAAPWRQPRPWQTLAPSQARFGLVAAQAARANGALGRQNPRPLPSLVSSSFGLRAQVGRIATARSATIRQMPTTTVVRTAVVGVRQSTPASSPGLNAKASKRLGTSVSGLDSGPTPLGGGGNGGSSGGGRSSLTAVFNAVSRGTNAKLGPSSSWLGVPGRIPATRISPVQRIKSRQVASGLNVKFRGDQAVVHFDKHATQIMRATGISSYNLKNYLQDANHVIENGKYVPELNGYVRLVGGRGDAKFAFVGLDRTSKFITTFHIKSATELEKRAPSLGISR